MGIQLAEGEAGHPGPVIGGPSGYDRIETGDNRVGVGPSQGYCLGGQPVPDLPHRVFARLGQQLAAEPADLEPQEVHPLVQVGDLRLVLVEGQAAGFQPSGEPCLNLLGLLPGMAESDQVVSVADQERAAGDCTAVPVVPDPGGLFHAVQCHVHEQRAGHAPNTVGNFCFEVTLGYRRVERGR